MIRSRILSAGGYLPADVVGNEELARRYGIDTTDAWIRERSGIRQRHLAAPGETCSSMGAAAARQAMARAGVAVDEVDAVIVATATPDSTFPATAVRIQAELGIGRGFAFDVLAACTGFIYALSVADAMLRAGQAKCALVIGAETYSRILDWTDRGSCVLFGDGAGAVVLRAEEGEARGGAGKPRGEAGKPRGGVGMQSGIISSHLHADGRHADILHVEGGPGSTGGTGLLRMAGREVFKHAVTKLAGVVDEALAANGLERSDIDWLVPHQANIRIIDAMGKKLGLPPERVVVTVDRHANTSAASIPLALADAVEGGRFKAGDLVLMEAIGGGLTWGAVLARW